MTHHPSPTIGRYQSYTTFLSPSSLSQACDYECLVGGATLILELDGEDFNRSGPTPQTVGNEASEVYSLQTHAYSGIVLFKYTVTYSFRDPIFPRPPVLGFL